jgi:DNA-binding winged helix-turn-helix (wHTH) protein
VKTALCPSCQSLHTPNGIIADGARGVVVWPGGEIRVTRTVFLLFETLFRVRGRAMTRSAVHDAMYGHDPSGGPELRCIDVHLSRLRRQLKEAGFPGEIRTIVGRGFELVLTVAPRRCAGGKRCNLGGDLECINGIVIDVDEFTEGWDPHVNYKPAPCHPLWCEPCKGTGEAGPEVADSDDCPSCQGTGYRGGKGDSQERLRAEADEVPA